MWSPKNKGLRFHGMWSTYSGSVHGRMIVLTRSGIEGLHALHCVFEQDTRGEFNNASCTDVRLHTLPIEIGTNQRALDELSHY